MSNRQDNPKGSGTLPAGATELHPKLGYRVNVGATERWALQPHYHTWLENLIVRGFGSAKVNLTREDVAKVREAWQKAVEEEQRGVDDRP